MKTKIIIIGLSISMMGCAGIIKAHESGIAEQTAGAVGCLSKDIKISNEETAFLTGAQEYVAECGGSKFVCNRYDGSNIRFPGTTAKCQPMAQSKI